MVSTFSRMTNPPSQLIKEAFSALKGQSPSDDYLRKVARQCLLPTEEVHIWFDHLAEVQKNRKRGAEKAAATRRLKKQQAAAQQVSAQQISQCAPGMQQAAQSASAQQMSQSTRGAQQVPECARGVQQESQPQQGAELMCTMDRGSTSQEACYCGACGDVYEETTDEVEEWIACDNCETWFHFSCVQINPVHVPEQFFCSECL